MLDDAERLSRPKWNGIGLVICAALTLTALSGTPVQATQTKPRPTGEGAPGSCVSAACPPFLALEPYDPGLDTGGHEFGDARSDHAAVVLAVASCFTELSNPREWTAPVRTAFMLESGGHYPYDHAPTSVRTETAAFSPYQAAALFFSDKLSRERLHFAQEIETTSQRNNRLAMLVVLFGASLTLVGGLRTLFPRNERPGLAIILGIAVLVVTSGSTALNGLTSSDQGPAQTVVNQRALAQLQQLHTRIVADTAGNPDTCSKNKNPSLNKIDAWNVRLEQILNAAGSTAAAPGDLLQQPAAPPAYKSPEQLQARTAEQPIRRTASRSRPSFGSTDPETVASASR